MTKEEAQKLLKAADRRKDIGTKAAIRDWIVVILGLNTGLRASEIAGLNCKHIELSNGENPNIFVEKGKTIYSRRRVPINTEVVEAIEQYKVVKMSWGESMDDDQPFLRSPHKRRYYRRENIYTMFKRVLDLAETIHRPKRFYAHSMRHTSAVQTYRKSGYNVELVRQLLGHSSIEVTMAYLAAFNCEKIAAVKGLYK